MTVDTPRILLVDDELEYLDWIVDYIDSKGHQLDSATSVEAALDMASKREYSAIVVDMNIPSATDSTDDLVRKFPGLGLIRQLCTNMRVPGKKILAFTVHDDDSIEGFLAKYGARYVLKGRPAAFKKVLESITDS